MNVRSIFVYRSVMHPLTLILFMLALASCVGPRGVRKAEVIRVNKEEADVRLTGNIMLDGGCSPKPYWSLEWRSGTGWNTCIPFPGAQALCGAGSWVYRNEVFHLQLGTWGPNHFPLNKGPLVPGTYRLVFMGPNGRTKRTREFRLEEPR